jgi:hypothetical protein
MFALIIAGVCIGCLSHFLIQRIQINSLKNEINTLEWRIIHKDNLIKKMMQATVDWEKEKKENKDGCRY